VRFFLVSSENPLHGDGVGVEAHVNVLALPGRKVLDSYTFLRLPTDGSVSKAVSRTVASDLADAYRAIAEAALEESILVYRGDDRRESTRVGPLSAFPDYVLLPIYPRVENVTDDGHIGARAAQRRMTDLQPTFRWGPLSASVTRDGRTESQIRDVTYELRLYRGV